MADEDQKDQPADKAEEKKSEVSGKETEQQPAEAAQKSAEEAKAEEPASAEATAGKKPSKPASSKSEKEYSKEVADIVAKVEKMSVLEVADLVAAIEDKFGVSAAPVAVAGAPTAAGEAGAEGGGEEKSTFTVHLAASGDQKINVIKAIREVTQLGLKEAKDLVDSAPKDVKENAPKEEAEEAKKKLEAAGAKVELK